MSANLTDMIGNRPFAQRLARGLRCRLYRPSDPNRMRERRYRRSCFFGVLGGGRLDN